MKTEEDDVTDNASVWVVPAVNPWPYLVNFFEFKGQAQGQGDTFIFLYECVLCRPIMKSLSANKKSRYSLRKHMESKHRDCLQEFLDCCQKGKKEAIKRRTSQPEGDGAKRQMMCHPTLVEMASLPECLLNDSQITLHHNVSEASTSLWGSEVPAVNPWPYLADFFKFKGFKGRGDTENFSYECVLCLPNKKDFSATKKSRYSLQKHIESKHSHCLQEFLDCHEGGMKVAKKRRTYHPKGDAPKRHVTHKPALAEVTDPSKQNYLSEVDDATKRQAFAKVAGVPSKCSHNISRATFQHKLVNMVVDNMFPFSVVDNPRFKEFTAMIPGSHNDDMSQSTLMSCMESRYETDKRKLKNILGSLPSVATTASTWTCRNGSNLGMTVHWIDQETLKRKKAVLACQSLKGCHTPDTVAKAIQDIHWIFGIENIVGRTTTDNGLSFVDAFKIFGEPELDHNGAKVEEQQDDSQDAAEVQERAAILEDHETEQPSHDLPKYLQCATHTLNLVVTVGAQKALTKSPQYKQDNCSVFGKAQELWKMEHMNPQASNVIKDEVGFLLVVPTVTRWKSVYDAVTCLVNIFNSNNAARGLVKACHALNIPAFTARDQEFLKAYWQVMEPVAKSLDILQGEERAYMGALVPTLALCLSNLNRHKNNEELSVCCPLTEALTEGLMDRFGHVFKDLDFLLATALNPQFKLSRWPELVPGRDPEEVRRTVTSKIVSLVDEARNEESSSGSEGEGADSGDFLEQLYDRRGSSKQKENIMLVNSFLDKRPEKIISKNSFTCKALIDLFVQYNTPIPSSVAVQNIFSLKKDILESKQSGLIDSDVEMLVFLKGNLDIL